MYKQGESSVTLYNTQIPTNYFFSQSPTSQQIHPQNTLIHASQPQNSIPILNPVQLQNVEQNSSSNSENQWQKVSRKRHRNLDDQENLNAKKQDYWLGGTITTTNRFSTLSEQTIEEEAKQSAEPKPPTSYQV
jgi:predicted Zn-dependent protease